MSNFQGTATRSGLSHRIVRMTGRDPNESHRAATSLELLFDLTLVVALGRAGDQLAAPGGRAGAAPGRTR
jgi:low temperature requirement protein LtrA